MRCGDHLGDEKMSKNGNSLCNGQKKFSQNERRAVLQSVASFFYNFSWGLSYDLSKFGDDFTPFFLFLFLKDHN